MGEGNIFTLCVEGYPIPGLDSGGGGGGLPDPRSGEGVPHPKYGQGGTQFPGLDGGRVPIPGLDWRGGVLHSRSGQGVTPPPRT